MAKICEITGKRTMSGNNVSHAHNKTKRKFYPNLQKKRIYISHLGISLPLYATTSAFRDINKNGIVHEVKKAYKKGTLASHLKPLVTIFSATHAPSKK